METLAVAMLLIILFCLMGIVGSIVSWSAHKKAKKNYDAFIADMEAKREAHNKKLKIKWTKVQADDTIESLKERMK